MRKSTTALILIPGILLTFTSGPSLGQDAAGQTGLNAETEHVRHMRPRKKPGVLSAAAVDEDQTQTPEKASVKVQDKTSLTAKTDGAPETKASASAPKKKPKKDKAAAPRRLAVTPDQPSPPETRPAPRGLLDDLFGND